MSILLDQSSRIIIQGITGKEGLFHAEQMRRFGSNLVAGVTPGKGGEWVLENKIPVFDSVKLAVETTGADTSVIFVPAKYAADAILEAINAEISLVICISEGIPIKDMMMVKSYLKHTKTRLVGPNSPGILSPGKAKAGIIPGNIAIEGSIGVVSRSGTLTYEVVYALKSAGLGVSTCVGIGGDPIIGSSFIDILDLFERDPNTEKIIMIGEIGGSDENEAANFISNELSKPVYGYIAGETAPPDTRMGHAGAIIEKGIGSAELKIQVLKASGVVIAHHPEEFPELVI
ncbi:MAG: succinate--CoA ligase subunit alpha [Anaerolineaceae bacterium]|nr:succinate--CoA ligase subunit alpha [Anaerolineaceae bacterium]